MRQCMERATCLLPLCLEVTAASVLDVFGRTRSYMGRLQGGSAFATKPSCGIGTIEFRRRGGLNPRTGFRCSCFAPLKQAS